MSEKGYQIYCKIISNDIPGLEETNVKYSSYFSQIPRIGETVLSHFMLDNFPEGSKVGKIIHERTFQDKNRSTDGIPYKVVNVMHFDKTYRKNLRECWGDYAVAVIFLKEDFDITRAPHLFWEY